MVDLKEFPLYPRAYTLVTRVAEKNNRTLPHPPRKGFDREYQSNKVKANTLVEELRVEFDKYFKKKRSIGMDSIIFVVNCIGKDEEIAKKFYLEDKENG